MSATERLVTATERVVTATERVVTATEHVVTATEHLVTATEGLVTATERLVTATKDPLGLTGCPLDSGRFHRNLENTEIPPKNGQTSINVAYERPLDGFRAGDRGSYWKRIENRESRNRLFERGLIIKSGGRCQ